MSEEKESKYSTSADSDSKEGRYSAKESSSHDVDEEDSTILEEGAKPPRRASVGWDDSGSLEGGVAITAPAETKRSRRRKGSAIDGSSAGDSKAPRNRHFDDDDETTEIVEIPDLEEEEREPDITTQVAEAPRNATRAVQSLKELDKDIKFALPSVSTFGVDLQMLTSVLCPEKAVLEADEPWSFDSLLNEVSQEFQKDVDDHEEFQRAEGG